MTTRATHTTIFRNAILALFVLACLFVAGKAFASSGDNVTGNAWSYNIGYISFNCTTQPGGCAATPEGFAGDDETPPDEDDTGIGDIGFFKNNKAISDGPLALFKRMTSTLDYLFIHGLFRSEKVFADEVGDLMSGSNYGVNVNPTTGIMSGYAWSSYAGWISFSEAGGCPAESCTPRIDFDDNKVYGFAKVLSATGASGWDGWISLSCANIGGCGGLFGSNYQVTYDEATGNLNGYAWGDEVVGWVKFSGPGYAVHVELEQPTIDLVATVGTMYCAGDPATLSWTTTGMASCSASAENGDPAFFGSVALNSASPVSISPSAPTTTYILSCIGNDGVTYNDSVTIGTTMCTEDASLVLSASPSPVTAATGYTTTLTWHSPDSTNYSSCLGKAYNVSVGVPPGTIAVPPTGFEGSQLPPNATGYTHSDAGVLVSNATDKFVIDCVRADTGEHVIADTLVARAILYPTCDFKEEGTYLSGTPVKATLEWMSTDAISISASSMPSVGAGATGWMGTKPFNGMQSNTNFISPSTTYFLDVGAGAETSQCKAVLDIPIPCDETDPEDSCYVDPNCEDPNGCDPDLRGSLSLTATPNVFTLGAGETATTSLEWEGNGLEGTGTTWSLPTTSFGPVNCEVDGTDVVTISASTTFLLTCDDMYGGPDISATADVTVNGIPSCDFIPDNDIVDCPIPVGGFTRPIFIER